MADEETMKANPRYRQADLGQRIAKLVQGDVLAGIPNGQDILASLFDPARPLVAPLRFGRKAAGVAALPMPPDRRRGSYAKPNRRRTATHARVNRGQDPRPQIH
jgi:hypothetical protein